MNRDPRSGVGDDLRAPRATESCDLCGARVGLSGLKILNPVKGEFVVTKLCATHGDVWKRLRALIYREPASTKALEL